VQRISNIGNAKDIAFEEEREQLRDSRWRRRRSMIGFSAFWVMAFVLALGDRLPPPWHLMSRFLPLP
jgi:hypothetical protein